MLSYVLIVSFTFYVTSLTKTPEKYKRNQGEISRTLTGNSPFQTPNKNNAIPATTLQKSKSSDKELVSSTKKTSNEQNESPLFGQKQFTFPLALQQLPKDEELSAKEALKTLEPEEAEQIDFQFENADLEHLVNQIAIIFKVSFIPDDAIQPLRPGNKQIKGNKITYKTNKPLSKKDAWSLFITFMNIAGFAVVPHIEPNMYRIEAIESALKAPLLTFFGTDTQTLPDNEELIRYVYFIENSTPDAIKNIIDPLRSTASSLLILQEHRGFILTDKAYNIKTLITIVKELDRVTMPQSMSVLKLKRVDAQQVKALYDSLIQSDDKNQPRFAGAPRKQPTSLFFPENIRIIAEPRTNALIILGAQDAIQKIEDFIIKHVDVELDQALSPLHVVQLKFADAETIAGIMNNVTAFGQAIPAGQNGGVRGEDKYLKQMSFTPEKETNRIIIKGSFEDFLRAKEIIEKLDEAQPQVVVEVLILSISLDETRELGMQIRSKASPNALDGLLGPNVKFQTSGLFTGNGVPSGIVENPTGPGVNRLLGNLLNLIVGAGPANTILTLGQDMFGVWGLLQALQKITNLQVVSNPFVFATNQTEAVVGIGQTRRVNTGTIVGSTTSVNSMGSDDALLTIKVKPQINSDGMIVLDLTVDMTNFTNPTDFTDPTKNTQKVVTKTIVANKEVIALGGLIRNTVNRVQNQTPLLGNIPLLGWFFKNKHKEEIKENLLILLSTRIIKPEETSHINTFTQERLADYYGTMDEMQPIIEKRDPIHRFFFENQNTQEKIAENFLFDRQKRSLRKRRKKKKTDENQTKATTPVENQVQPQAIVQSNGTEAQQNNTPYQQPNLSSMAAALQNNNTKDALNSKLSAKKRKRISLTNLVAEKNNKQEGLRG